MGAITRPVWMSARLGFTEGRPGDGQKYVWASPFRCSRAPKKGDMPSDYLSKRPKAATQLAKYSGNRKLCDPRLILSARIHIQGRCHHHLLSSI